MTDDLPAIYSLEGLLFWAIVFPPVYVAAYLIPIFVAFVALSAAIAYTTEPKE